MTQRLRYTGTHALSFTQPHVGHVEPGGEFDVRDEDVVRFMRRPDVEHAGECPAPPCRCGDEPAPDPEPAAPRRRRRAADEGGEAATTPDGGEPGSPAE